MTKLQIEYLASLLGQWITYYPARVPNHPERPHIHPWNCKPHTAQVVAINNIKVPCPYGNSQNEIVIFPDHKGNYHPIDARTITTVHGFDKPEDNEPGK